MNNDWIDQISQQMEHHEVEVPEGLWEGIERELEARKPVRRAKLVWMWRAGAVAASVAGVVAGVQLWQNRNESPLAEERPRIVAEPGVPREEQALAQVDGPASNVLGALENGRTNSLQPNVEETVLPNSFVEEADAGLKARIDVKEVQHHEQTETPLHAEATVETDEEEVYLVVRTNTSQSGVVPVTKRNHSKRVSFQLLAATSAVVPFGANYDNNMGYMGGNHGIGSSLDNVSDGNPSDSIFVSSPRLLSTAVCGKGMQEVRTAPLYTKHYFPVKVGFAVRVPISRIFALDCGLNYTRLHSSFSLVTPCMTNGQQYVNYLGVPVSFVVNILDNRCWNIYAAAGGEVAKSVKTVWQDNNATVSRASGDPWQTSVSAAVGVQLNFSKHVGFYVQPSLDYYFDNHSSVQTYYNEHPFTPALRMGVRVKL